MLATLVQMTRDGKDEMVMYMLHKLNPHAIEIAESDEKKDKSEINIGVLLNALFN